MAGRADVRGVRGARDGATVAQVDGALRELLSRDARQGARAAVAALPGVVRRIPELSAEPACLRDPDRELIAALAELCEVIGWILFDAGLHRRAARANARALALADLCGDRAMARLVLLNHAMLQTHTGRPRAALATVDRVSGPRPLPARVDVLVQIRRAHALALLGDGRASAALIARARHRFLDGPSRRDPAWAWWIDGTELLGHEGWVLARLGRWDRAVPLLQEAAAAPGGPSYRDLFGAELLSALAGAGAWRDAEDLIAGLAPRAAGIGSGRTAGSLGATAAGLRRRADVPASLREAATHLLEALSGRARPPAVRP
ncbi:DNA-binding protein [Streptomyces sp. NPDC052114]|uniref:DNA-binding protein n=1 Tax=unclassified Streptomyces TaxID=2593676 RepID=UPI003444DED1